MVRTIGGEHYCAESTPPIPFEFGGIRDRLRPSEPLMVVGAVGRAVRKELWVVGVFSLIVNVLALAGSLYMMQLFDRVLTSESRETLIFLTLLAVAATLVAGLLMGLRRQLLARIGEWLTAEIASPAIDAAIAVRLQGQPPEGSKAFRSLMDIRAFFTSESIVALMDAPWIPVYVVIIAFLHPILGLFSLIAAAMLLACAFAHELVTRPKAEQTAAQAARAQRMVEEVEGLAEIAAALGMRTRLLLRWRHAHDDASRAGLILVDRGTLLVGLVHFLRQVLQLTILALGAWLVLDRSLTSGGMIAASILLSRALAPVDKALPSWKAFVSARIGLATLRDLFARAPGRPAREALPRPVGRLSVEKVTYRPLGADAPLLREISFCLEPGEVLGIVGPSGAGKSTLGHILSGAWRPSQGIVRLDRAAFEYWDDDRLGAHVGFMPQYPSLFAGTCAENIARMGSAEPGTVMAAAELAGAHELILRLPDGYETLIGPHGHRLSGGEQQRLALARALFGEPSLVVLDEPDAFADTATAQRVVGAIERLKARGATVVVISHQPAMIRHADRLLVLQDGRVAALGPPERVKATILESTKRNILPLSAAGEKRSATGEKPETNSTATGAVS